MNQPTMHNKIGIAICGKTYAVNCPTGEEAALDSAVSYINDFITDLRQNSPNVSDQENLLVLCCLNLFDELRASQDANDQLLAQIQEAKALIDKIDKGVKDTF